MKTAKKSLSILLALAMVFTMFTCLGLATVSAQAAPTTADAAYHMKSNNDKENDVQVGILNTDLVQGETYTFSVDYYTVANGFFTNGQWGFASGWSGPQYANYRSAGKGHIQFSFTADAPSVNVDAKAAQGGDGSQFASATGVAFHVFPSGEYYLWNAQFKDAAGNVLPNTYVIKWACNGGQSYLYETMTKSDLPICVDGLHDYQQVDVQAATCQAVGTINLVCTKCGRVKTEAEVEGFDVDDNVVVGVFDFTTVANPSGNDAFYMCRPKSAWTSQHVKYTFDYYMDAPMIARAGNNTGKDYNGGNLQQGYHHYEGINPVSDSGAYNGYLQIKVIRNSAWGGNTVGGHIYVWNLKAYNAETNEQYAELGYEGGGVTYCPFGGPEALPAAVIETEAGEHNFEAQSANATCTTPGETTYVCATCGHVKNVADASAQVSAPLDSDVVYKFHYTKDTPDVGGTSYIPFALGALTVGDTWSLEFDYYTTGPNFSVNNWGANFMLTPSGGGFGFVNGAGHYSATQTVEEGKTNGHEFILQGTTNNADMYIWNVRLTHNGVADNRWETSNRAGSAHPYGPTTVKTNGTALPIVKEESVLGDHDYVLTDVVSATCTEDGVANYVCSVCGHVKNIADEAGVPAEGAVYKFASSEEGKGFLPSKVYYGLTASDVVTFSFDYYSEKNVNLLAQNYSGAQHTYTKTSQIVAGINHAEFVATNFNGSFLPNIFEWTKDNLEIYIWNVSLTKNDGDNEFTGFLSGSDHIVESALPAVEKVTPASGNHSFGEWVLTEETVANDASATRSCGACGETETVAAKDIVKADWSIHYADAKGGSSQYPGFYFGRIGSLEADDVVTVEFDYSHPDYDAATNILKIRSNNGESATEFNLVEDGVVTTNRTIKGTGGHVVATYVNTQARGEIYAGLQESVHKGADDVYVWNIKFYVNGEEVTSDKDAFDNITINNSNVVLSHPYAAQLQIGKQTKGESTRLIMKICGDASVIEAYDSVGFKLVIDGVAQEINVDSVYDSFYNNGKLVTAESLGCTYVAILEIGNINTATSVTAQGMINGTVAGTVRTIK